MVELRGELRFRFWVWLSLLSKLKREWVEWGLQWRGISYCKPRLISTWRKERIESDGSVLSAVFASSRFKHPAEGFVTKPKWYDFQKWFDYQQNVKSLANFSW